MARTVEQYIYSNQHWDKELHKLREICNNSELTEEVKWGAPCYTLNGKNVIGINGFKSYVGIWFHQGVFLKDPHQLLEQSDDTTKGLRKMMFQKKEEAQFHQDLMKYARVKAKNQTNYNRKVESKLMLKNLGKREVTYSQKSLHSPSLLS